MENPPRYGGPVDQGRPVPPAVVVVPVIRGGLIIRDVHPTVVGALSSPCGLPYQGSSPSRCCAFHNGIGVADTHRNSPNWCPAYPRHAHFNDHRMEELEAFTADGVRVQLSQQTQEQIRRKAAQVGGGTREGRVVKVTFTNVHLVEWICLCCAGRCSC
jgi:hypothetical protein